MIEIVFNFVVELTNCAIACIGSKRPIHFDLCCGNINHIDQEFGGNIFQPEEHFLFICYEVIKCRKWSATLRKIFIDLHYNWRIINNCNRCSQLGQTLNNFTSLNNQQARNPQHLCEIFGFRLNQQSQCMGKFGVGKELLRDRDLLRLCGRIDDAH